MTDSRNSRIGSTCDGVTPRFGSGASSGHAIIDVEIQDRATHRLAPIRGVADEGEMVRVGRLERPTFRPQNGRATNCAIPGNSRRAATLWTLPESSRRHPACKAGALPTELKARMRPPVERRLQVVCSPSGGRRRRGSTGSPAPGTMAGEVNRWWNEQDASSSEFQAQEVRPTRLKSLTSDVMGWWSLPALLRRPQRFRCCALLAELSDQGPSACRRWGSCVSPSSRRRRGRGVPGG